MDSDEREAEWRRLSQYHHIDGIRILGYQIWHPEQTPDILCGDCQGVLVSDRNGNAPLEFTLADLIEATQRHTCPKDVQ